MQIIQRDYNDFDELSVAAQKWRLQLQKLDTGPFHGNLFQMITKNFILSRGRFHSQVKQAGEPPVGFRTVVVSARRESRFFWRGRPVTGDDLLVFPLGGELASVSRPGFDVFTISLPEDDLEEMAESMGLARFGKRLDSAEVFRDEDDHLDGLRRALQKIQTDAVAGNVDSAGTRDYLIRQVVMELSRRDPMAGPVQERATHLDLICRTGEYIAHHEHEAVQVKDLAANLGVSIRTLEYAFSRHLGIGPKAYLKSLRLNAVRDRLWIGRVDTMAVADAANLYGFWHMGQFAADYRGLFGELPSATLKRS